MTGCRTISEFDESASKAMLAETKDVPGSAGFFIAVWTVLAAVTGGRKLARAT